MFDNLNLYFVIVRSNYVIGNCNPAGGHIEITLFYMGFSFIYNDGNDFYGAPSGNYANVIRARVM